MLPWRKREVLALRVEARRELAVADVVDLKRFSNRPCTTWGDRGTSARTDAGGPMRAYSMDLRCFRHQVLVKRA